METYDSLLVELDSLDRHLSRRKFLKILVFAATPLRLALEGGDREFLRKVAATLISPEALSRTGIDVIANVEHLLLRGSAEHRARFCGCSPGRAGSRSFMAAKTWQGGPESHASSWSKS